MQLCVSTVDAADANLLNFSLNRDDLVEKKAKCSSSSSSSDERGPRGHRGPRGKIGCNGPQGLQGIQGPKGTTGTAGPAGATGAVGPQGPQGPQGVPGVAGATGAVGPTGPQGPQGIKGATGATGAKGDKGCRGKRGKRGHSGHDGCDGKQGEPGPQGRDGIAIVNPLSCDVFVDSCTLLPEHEQTGSISAPFATIQRAIDKAKFANCTSCKNCKTVNILIAAGCYNLGSEQSMINITGPTKVNLIGLGPVTLGETGGCACQPDGENSGVSIYWQPIVCDVNSGIRPTLTITTLNTIADSITPYQSYANKFRISGNVMVVSKACGNGDCSASTSSSHSSSTTENGVHYRYHESNGVRVHSDGDMTRWHSSTNRASNSDFSYVSSSTDETRHGRSSTNRKHSGNNILFTDSGSTWANNSSVRVHVGRDNGRMHRSENKLYRSSSGSERYDHNSTSTHFTRGDYPSDAYSTGHQVAGKVKNGKKKAVVKGKKANAKKAKVKFAKVNGKVKGKKKVEKGVFDFLGLAAKKDVALQAEDVEGCGGGCCDLCYASLVVSDCGTCLPAELHLNAEVFGDLNVTNVAMLYIYKSRIHGYVNAQESDLVVAERTRFENAVNIHYYGFVSYSEILQGVTVSGTHLWDGGECGEGECGGANCNSLFLKGFFNTFFCGDFSGPEGSCFTYDPVTGCSFVKNNSQLLGDAELCPLVSYNYQTEPFNSVTSCLSGQLPD